MPDVSSDREETGLLPLPDRVTEIKPRIPARPPLGNPMFLDLGEKFPEGYTWSNKAADMALDVYFDPGKPNIAEEYAVDGLKPVLRELDSQMYLLTADNGKFYMWAADDGRLYVFKDDLRLTMDEAIHKVLTGVMSSDLLRQFNKNFR